MSTSLSGGSATCVVELDEIRKPQQLPATKEPSLNINRRLSRVESQNSRTIHDKYDADGTLPSPTTATEELQKWNYPKKNMLRTFAAFWGFIVMGANDAAVGVSERLLYNMNLKTNGSARRCSHM
jgi:hypothetical protein